MHVLASHNNSHHKVNASVRAKQKEHSTMAIHNLYSHPWPGMQTRSHILKAVATIGEQVLRTPSQKSTTQLKYTMIKHKKTQRAISRMTSANLVSIVNGVMPNPIYLVRSCLGRT